MCRRARALGIAPSGRLAKAFIASHRSATLALMPPSRARDPFTGPARSPFQVATRTRTGRGGQAPQRPGALRRRRQAYGAERHAEGVRRRLARASNQPLSRAAGATTGLNPLTVFGAAG